VTWSDRDGKKQTSERYLEKDCDGCGFRWLRDLNAEALRKWLRSHSEMGAATYNWHSPVWSAFGSWLCGWRLDGRRKAQTGDRRLTLHAFAGFGKKHDQDTRRRVARALTLFRDLIADGIDKIDERDGRVRLHALRHSTGTHLSTAGVSPRTAQAVMRHSNVNLTMGTYTDQRLLDTSAAVELLPNRPLAGPTQQDRTEADTQRNTGDGTGSAVNRPGGMGVSATERNR